MNTEMKMMMNLTTYCESEESKDDNRIEQVAAIACVIDDGMNENSEFEIEDDKELLPLYSVKQKESVNDVVINLISVQNDRMKSDHC